MTVTTYGARTWVFFRNCDTSVDKAWLTKTNKITSLHLS